MTTPEPGTNVPQPPTLDRREGVEDNILWPLETPPFDHLPDFIADDEDGQFDELDFVETVQFKDVEVGQNFFIGELPCQRIAVTSPPKDNKTHYYFRANARIVTPWKPVEYIHLLDASLVQVFYQPRDQVELTPKGFNLVSEAERRQEDKMTLPGFESLVSPASYYDEV